MIKKCSVCGFKVMLPSKIEESEKQWIECSHCGAVAQLKFKKRNGRIDGLKGNFVSKDIFLFNGKQWR